MRVLLENKAIGRTVNIEVSDSFMQNPDDIRIVAGTECYKLVSTKSEEDKKRETLGIEFANEVFPEIQKMGITDDAELEKTFTEKLQSDKYKDLVAISEPKMLMSTILTSYKRYEMISNKILELDKKIKDSIIDQNVFFDYIKRLRNLITNATTLKDFHDGIFELKEMSQCDDRVAIGISTIFECVADLITEEQVLIGTLNPTNDGKSLKDSDVFTNMEFWTSRFAPKVKGCVDKLNALEEHWRSIEADMAQHPVGKNKFELMLAAIIHCMKPLVAKSIEMRELLKSDSDAVAIERVRDDLKQELTNYHTEMRRLEIVEYLDPRKYDTTEESVFIDTRFSEYRELEHTATECAYTGEKYSLQDYLLKLTLNYKMCLAVKAGIVDIKKLLEGGYTENEIRNIIESTAVSNTDEK